MPERKLNNDGRKSGIKYAVIIATILTTVLAGGVLAKYIMDSNSTKNTVVAKEFYFTSDLLTEEGESYVLSPGKNSTASITFTIGNNADELRCSEDDIEYTVAITKGETLIKTDEGILNMGAVNTASITVGDLEKGETYTVIAIGKAGYKKTLKAEFTVAGDDKAMYKSVTQNTHYVSLTVWTKNIKGIAGIDFPNELIVDDTDTVIAADPDEYGIIADTTSFINTYSSHTYRFFKTSSKVYDENDFRVVLDVTDSSDDISIDEVIIAIPE